MSQLNQFLIRQLEMRNHPLRRRLPPITKLILGLAKNSQRNRRVKLLNCREHFRKKRRDHISLWPWIRAQQCKRLRFQPGNLQLDVKKRPMRKLPQNIFQRGQRQILRICLLDLHPADGIVVANYSPPIAGTTHVKLKTIAAML